MGPSKPVLMIPPSIYFYIDTTNKNLISIPARRFLPCF